MPDKLIHDPKNPSSYQKEVSANNYKMVTDQHYWMMEHLTNMDAEKEPALYQSETQQNICQLPETVRPGGDY
jgi:hypothetical protein